MRICTRRLLLRDFLASDRRAFVAYQLDPRYRRLYDLEENEQHANGLFDRFLCWKDEIPRLNFQVGIFEFATGRLRGCAGLRRAEAEEGTAVLGIELAPEYWGRHRLAIEAVSALIEYGFSTLDLHAVIGYSGSGNKRVERLARWFGATIVARRTGPPWMVARGWSEVGWALKRDSWMESDQRRRIVPASGDKDVDGRDKPGHDGDVL
jgi:ribosomal-protein-alanine N-acetyltransferase